MRKLPVLLTIFAALSCTTFSVSKDALNFPRDHGNHTTAQTEWWYLQSVVHTSSGRRLSLFVSTFRHNPADDRFLWLPFPRLAPAGNTVIFFGCVMDLDSGEVIAEKWAPHWTRALNEPGPADGTFELEKGHWRTTGSNGHYVFEFPSKLGKMRVRVSQTAKPLPIGSANNRPGEIATGYHHFKKAEFNYYSYPRAKIAGQITAKDGASDNLWGEGWFDHQYGFIYSSLYRGWWWAGIMLEDGTDLLVTKVTPLKDGVDAVVLGVMRRPGEPTKMVGKFDFKPISHWKSDRTDAEYPTEVRIVSDAGDFDLKLKALRNNMEWDVEPAWIWEGPVSVVGSVDGKPVKGTGFAEFLEEGDRFARYFYSSGL